MASCPALAWASAAAVSMSLLPLPVMKSACTSTLFFSAQALTCFCITSFPPGTQWSQKPMLTFPAAPAVRMCTNGKAVAAAASLSAPRRDTVLDRVIVVGLPDDLPDNSDLLQNK